MKHGQNLLDKKSPSTRRVWIEIISDKIKNHVVQVTLHTEGVDRNRYHLGKLAKIRVTLHTEGVDRNCAVGNSVYFGRQSPSTRRVWIEISKPYVAKYANTVTLHTEGVDRNCWM